MADNDGRSPGAVRWARLASVRIRITVLATLIVGLTLTVAGFALVSLQREGLTDNLDTTILARMADLQADLGAGAPPGQLSTGDEEAQFVQLVDSAGTVAAATSNMIGERPVLTDAADGSVRTVRGLPLEGGVFRVRARTIEAPSGRYTILVGGSLEDVSESAAILTRLLAVGIPLVLLVVAGGSWLMVGRALAPVEAIRREVATISERDLQRRVPEPVIADEVGRLARTMNGMLARLQAAYRRQSDFVADAAHELRSPLASLRTQIEVDVPIVADDRTVLSLTAEVDRMARLIDDLLVLASVEQAQAMDRSVIDFDDVVLTEVRRLQRPEAVAVDASAVSAAAVRGDASQLARAVRNLLENAARHARTRVVVDLLEDGHEVMLRITDDGPGIPAGEELRIFERFARLDASRARDSGGAGLGLAIAREIILSHAGTVAVDAAHRDGARFAVSLPSVK